MPMKLTPLPPAKSEPAQGLNSKQIQAQDWMTGRKAALIPLVERGKQPINKGGSRSPLTKWEDMKDFFAQRPDANYGVVTGAISKVFCLDIDGQEGIDSLKRLKGEYGSLPRTTTVKTPRGFHKYFRHPGKPVGNSAGKLAPGIDVRGDGGYVVGVGSMNEVGVKYAYVLGRTPKEVGFAEAPDWLIALVSNSPADVPDTSAIGKADHHQAYVEAALQREVEHLRAAPKGKRNLTLNSCAFKVGQLLPHGLLDVNLVIRELEQAARLIGLNENEIGPTIRSGLEAGQKHARQLPVAARTDGKSQWDTRAAGAHDELTEQLASLGQTDADNAERFARRFGHKVIYTPGRGLLTFDGVRWHSDTLLKGIKLAEKTARLIARETDYLAKESDKAARAHFAQQSLSKSALDRMRELAKSRLVKEDSMLDANPWLLNVINGTVDLRTGTVREHDAGDLITKLAPVAFDKDAECPNFRRFLASAFRGDAELMTYVQKAAGYTLTGDVREQVFFLPKGPGKTGKSTFLHLFRDLLGDYGVHTPSETLLDKKYEGIPSDLARFAGARMVTAVEANWTRQIDEARIKALTGGDLITARFLYAEFFEFTPQLKLWFAVNDFPGVRGTAGAFWRRVRVIPFTVEVGDEDADLLLPQKLRGEMPGILNWAIQGCLAWQREALGLPQAIKNAGGQWKQAADHVRKFVNESITAHTGGMISSSDLYSRYRAWCQQNGETASGDDRKLKAAFESLDLTSKRVAHGTMWLDVKFRVE